MVIKRRLDYGFNGYHAPAIPRAPRSVRGRGLRKKTSEDGQLCAFELLATVAGKLLQECESSSASSSAPVGVDHHIVCKDTIKLEPQDVDKPSGPGQDDQGSSGESTFFSRLHLQSCNLKETDEEVPGTINEHILKHVPAIANSACSRKVDSDVQSVNHKTKDVKLNSKLEEAYPKFGESSGANIWDGINRQCGINRGVVGSKDPVGLCKKFPAVDNSNNNVELPLCGDSIPSASFPRHRNDVKIESRDDDEILSQSSEPSTRMKAIQSQTHIVDQKVKKLPTSNCWKVASKLKDPKLSNTGSSIKHIYQNRKSNYEHQRSQFNTPFKKRKLFDRSSVVTYDGGISSESASNSPEKGVDDNKSGWSAKMHAGNGVSSSIMCDQKSVSSRNSYVKFTIESFKVPELFIEVPESTTVSSLKKTVLEALTAVLGDGLRVGVLLHGKRIRDDNRTLLQTGISHYNNLETLGFILEPSNPAQPSTPLCSEAAPATLICESPKDCVNRSQTFNEPYSAADKPLTTDSGSYAEGSQDLVPLPMCEMGNKTEPESRDLVLVPEASMEALAVVPVNERPRCSEIGQRRTRRPFSVSEVEALVQAVEKLGTGRWRDVKLCAFENAKHRTYVDLKDKWKTLVHTARISPQQRRGEPVPQELLDRVLAAHAYWTQHQAKQHGKQHPGILKITGLPTEKVAA
ncbi:hypothetical protein Ancab_034358 [Ancistrocladus abbreviatus]